MGTNLVPILANLYLAMLQEELKIKVASAFFEIHRRWFRNHGRK